MLLDETLLVFYTTALCIAVRKASTKHHFLSIRHPAIQKSEDDPNSETADLIQPRLIGQELDI
jgi:hypothetical protein